MDAVIDTGKGKYRDEYCRAPLCNGNARIQIDLSYYHIPSVKEMDLRRKWIVAIRRDEGPNFKKQENENVHERKER
ncbi:hypothetical protein CHS0354_032041 [Potamilus streckersoni]|uniref:THAP-type domain-containing protein n=1 Tax=Potamilus streckersoni TaxID=2493646 RepID=A0AAE0TLD2_9BIVA|nr:hypothetical protein CHS0354_032041 [Potamilus streckersoni]